MTLNGTDKQEWQKLYATALGVKDFEVRVNLDNVSNKVTELRYFFPLANRLYREKRISASKKLTLNVFLPKKEDNSSDEGDNSRVRTFLALWKQTPYISVKINDRELQPSTWVSSHIFPLCTVAVPDDRNKADRGYQVLKTCFSGEEDKLQEFFNLAQTMVDYVKQIDYAGDTKSHLTSGEKEALRQEVNMYMDNHLCEMPILARIIWMYVLKELIRGKALYTLKAKKSDVPRIHKNILAKSRLDAISYGEGMYQLIENACLHSGGHRAWFGFRMYRAGRNVTMSDLPPEVNTRVYLYKYYKDCFSPVREGGRTVNIFNQDYRFYFEFFVLDSAVDDAGQVGMVLRHNEEEFQGRRGIVQDYYLSEEEKLAGISVKHFADISDRERWDIAEETAAKKTGREFRKFSRSMYDLFHLCIRDKSLEDHLQDITVHYGLRLLRRIVSVNNGYLMGWTPDGAGRTLRYNNENPPSAGDDEAVAEDSYITEWNVIIPISNRWPSQNIVRADGRNPDYPGAKVPAPRDTLVHMDYASIFQGVGAENKQEGIATVQTRLEDILSRKNTALEQAVILLDLDRLQEQEVELLAKALFRQIALINYGGQKTPLRVALLFPGPDMLHEFIRWYSVFYINGKQPDMEGVQIALCARNSAGTLPCTQLILTGAFLSDAQKNAALFAYNHSMDTLEYVPLLLYLMQTGGEENDSSELAALLPFDLFLPAHIPEGTGSQQLQGLPWGDNWFTARVAAALNTDLREKNYGCLIKDTHVRLGSKIHLNCFCEAELLFHNMGNVSYFAYLIVQELLYGGLTIQEDLPVLLLGYEKYSSSLILQIEYWLKQSLEHLRVYSAIVHDGHTDGEVCIKPYFDSQFVSSADLEGVQIVTALPVGTTLSTVYKMHNCARRFIAEKRNGESAANAGLDAASVKDTKTDLLGQADVAMSFRNFCLVLINKDLFAPDGNLSPISKRYWNTFEKEAHIVTVEVEKSDKKSDDTEKRVKYLLPVNAQWFSPEECPVCRKRGKEMRPIIDVKHSETEPGAIFNLREPVIDGFRQMVSDPNENRRRINGLFHNVHYSHIYTNKNHFQFCIDFEALFRENHQAIYEDLGRKTIRTDAYHVLVVPLQFANSGFVKAVTDVVFQGRVRVLRVNLADIYREEMRVKFSFLVEDYRRVKQSNPDALFRIHFADSSIVTGNLLNRARLLVQMLLEQSGVPYENVKLFDQVFLMVNRSSYDSMNFFARDPKKSLYAYIQLTIPSYNTENDQCPACRVTKRYDLLGKRSSTERLSGEFSRLKEKHGKRSREEYETWLDGSILNSPAYFAWLLQWLYVNAAEDPEDKLHSFVEDAADAHYERLAHLTGVPSVELRRRDRADAHTVADTLRAYLRERRRLGRYQLPSEGEEWTDRARKKYLSDCAEPCIGDVVEFASTCRKGPGPADGFQTVVLRLVHRQLIDVRDYMRLYSMQRAYEVFGEIEARGMERSACREKILELIADEMKPLEGVTVPEEYHFSLTRNIEWLISYIKVISREHLVNYYDCRQAITGIMSDLLSIINHLNHSPYKDSTLIRDLQKESRNWKTIIETLMHICLPESKPGFACGQLCALLQYQLQMMLIHRMADLQITIKINAPGVKTIIDSYTLYLERYFANFDLKLDRCTEEEPLSEYIVLPTADKMLIRFLKATKVAAMLSSDAVPCLQLARMSKSLEGLCVDRDLPQNVREELLFFARYIYLENTQMLYTGMRDIEKSIPAEFWDMADSGRPADDFPSYMERLNEPVTGCLRDCYSNLDKEGLEKDIRYQNVLGNFCRFWHRSTGEAAASCKEEDAPVHTLTYMLHYFRRVNSMSEGREIDELPYLYEELCRTICGLTGFQMSYIAFEKDGNYPEIFTQSGYYVDLMDKILTPQRMDRLLRFAREAEKGGTPGGDWDKLRGEVLVPNVTILYDGTEECDYLLLSIPLKNDKQGNNEFHLVMQSRMSEKIYGTQPLLRNKIALRKARDILFMRETLQEILSRDYTVLINFRFDCSYVRPYDQNAKDGPALLHISDLHIAGPVDSLRVKTRETLKETLGGAKVDLLVVTGDVVDSKAANAPQIEDNYKRAKELLNEIVCVLWTDKARYLSHDWKRRVVITTGNHDYASMNQYHAAQRRRALVSAMPVDRDSSVMSKFAYFIDFLVSYLDPPVNELLRNDLNEVRNYRNLNLRLLCLNCSSLATPRRTNKMGVNREKVLELVRRNAWSDARQEVIYWNGEHTMEMYRPFRLCVAHYSPKYQPIYFLDNYSWMPGWEWDPEQAKICCINRLSRIFCEAIQEELRYRTLIPMDDKALPEISGTLKKKRDKLVQEVYNLDGAMEDLENDRDAQSVEFEPYYNRLKVSANGDVLKIVRKVRENDLYLQLKLYAEWLRKSEDLSNEKISKLIFEVNESIQMGKWDELNFKELMKEIGEISQLPIDLYLAGHVHAYTEWDPEKGGDKEDRPNIKYVLVADRLYDKERPGVHGYLIQNMRIKKNKGADAPEKFKHRRFGAGNITE